NVDVPESKHKPGKKMKGLFWTAIKPDASKSSNSLWSKVDLKNLDDLELDYIQLEDCFSQSESTARPAVNVKTKEASVLDMTRTQNVEISSRGLNRTPNGLVQLVLELNPVELTLEATEICLSLVPTPSDISAIRGHHGPDAELGKAGQLLKALIDVPRLKERLECHKIIFSWNKTMDSVRAGNQMLDRACGELLSAASTAKLSKLLSVILAVGNFMNGGSSRVAAAVKLDSLLKLSTVKAANGQRGTLLHFVIKQLQNKFPDVLDFYMDWTCVTAASGISLTLLLSDKKCLM
ncbi:inf2, partial [Symbiodinium microadriaticum]